MFRHYRVILKELVINSLSSYTTVSNAAVGNTIIFYYQQLQFDMILIISSLKMKLQALNYN